MSQSVKSIIKSIIIYIHKCQTIKIRPLTSQTKYGHHNITLKGSNVKEAKEITFKGTKSMASMYRCTGNPNVNYEKSS